MTDTDCRICHHPTETIFRSPGTVALLSSAVAVEGTVVVDGCTNCGHAQTRPVLNLDQYYASEYQFRTDSAEEDDLYDRRDGRNVYRSEHQATTAETMLNLDGAPRVLDYGCGKALSLRLIKERSPKIEPYVFDVSDSYRRFWNDFVPSQNQASFETPLEWAGKMDIVTAFFALEHVDNPHGFLASTRALLKDDGQLLALVPNVLGNYSDLVVIDHVNHFSRKSLSLLFAQEGFKDVNIASDAYRGAFVVTARRASGSTPGSADLSDNPEDVRAVAAYWRNAVERIRNEEKTLTDGRAAVYGSGIYGQFIVSVLQDRKRIECFLDQNPYRYRLVPFGIPIKSPEQVPDSVGSIFVGLNPVIAHQAIREAKSLHRVPRRFFFL